MPLSSSCLGSPLLGLCLAHALNPVVALTDHPPHAGDPRHPHPAAVGEPRRRPSTLPAAEHSTGGAGARACGGHAAVARCLHVTHVVAHVWCAVGAVLSPALQAAYQYSDAENAFKVIFPSAQCPERMGALSRVSATASCGCGYEEWWPHTGSAAFLHIPLGLEYGCGGLSVRTVPSGTRTSILAWWRVVLECGRPNCAPAAFHRSMAAETSPWQSYDHECA